MAKRFSLSDLPQAIPVFPLTGALLLPRARLPLNIFEPRYLAMLDDALKTPDRLIGMVQPCEAPSGCASNGLHQIGCAGRVVQFSETDDGRYQILLQGVSRYRIQSESDGFHPYRRAQVNWGSFEQDLGPRDIDQGFDRPGFLKLLQRYFEAHSLSSDWSALEEADSELLVNSLSMLLDFSAEDKQALLEAPDLTNRRETLVTLIEFALCGGDGGTPVQ